METTDNLERWKRRLAREKKARKEAEKILEEKSRQLYWANQELQRAHAEVEEKNRKITASIRYAQRIQQAILPLPEELKKFFPEILILFSPKELISGDFYWFREVRDRKLLAVVDYTGHGVPGALLVMVGNMHLHEIVQQTEDLRPGKILEELHTRVRETLQQEADSSTTMDGMDVCLCCFDSARTLQFAGAGRSLYVVRGERLERIRGDLKSIGGHQKEPTRTFTTHVITGEPGDMLYLMSDGFVDQGDPEGKKFGSRKLKGLLASIATKSAPEQKEILVRTLEDHRRDEEQRDDITLLGVKLP